MLGLLRDGTGQKEYKKPGQKRSHQAGLMGVGDAKRGLWVDWWAMKPG